MDNRDRLLAKIRRGNAEESSFERDIGRISWKIGAIVGTVIAVLVFLFEWIFCGSLNFGVFLLFSAAMSSKFLIEVIKYRDTENIIFAVGSGITFVLVAVAYVLAFIYGEI